MVVVASRPSIFFLLSDGKTGFFSPLPFNHSRSETRVLKDGRDAGAHGSRVSARGVGRRMGQPPCSHTRVDTRSRLLFFDGLSLLLLLFRCTHAHCRLDPLGGRRVAADGTGERKEGEENMGRGGRFIALFGEGVLCILMA